MGLKMKMEMEHFHFQAHHHKPQALIPAQQQQSKAIFILWKVLQRPISN